MTAEERLRLVLDSIDGCLWTFDFGSRTVSTDQRSASAAPDWSESFDGATFEEFLDHVAPGDRDRVRNALSTGELSFECRLTEPDGGERWVAVTGESLSDGTDRSVDAVARDITEQKRLKRALRTEEEHFRIALENSPFTAFRLDTDLRYTWIGNPHADFDPDAIIGNRDDELLPPEAAETVMAPKREALETGEGVRREVTYDLASGTVNYDLTVEPLRDDGGDIVGLTAAAMDVTHQKELERMLAGLHEASRGVVGAISRLEAARQVLAAATEVLGVDAVGVFLFDEGDNVLRPAATSDRFDDWYGGMAPAYGPQHRGPAWQSFIEEETLVRASDADGEAPIGSGLYVPLGNHGVLTLVGEDRLGVDDRVQQTADHLAATAEMTLDRIEREDALRDAERTLAERNDRLTDLNRINDIIRDIDQALIQAETAEGIEQAVCDRLTQDERFAFAWIGERAGDDVTVRTWAGPGEAYLDSLPLSAADATDGASEPDIRDEPSVRTAAAGGVAYEANVAENLRGQQWRRRALAHDFQSVISIAVQYEGVQYGVLTVYATEPGAFDPLSRAVMAELGDTIGNAINAVETRRLLHTDSVVELKLTISAPGSPLVGLAASTGGRIDVHGTVPQQNDRTRVFVSVEGVDTDAFRSAAGAAEHVEQVSVLEDMGQGARFELVVTGQTVPATLVTLGAVARQIRLADSTAEVTVELPQSTAVRTFIERLEATFPETELHARRDRNRSEEEGRQLRTPLFEDLTERQREVLQTAYLSGYFEWPRERTGEEVAASLDITQSTFNNHLRTAERKLLAQLLGQRPSVSE